jgi:very-short-patch-repair endonuclease
MLNKLYNLKYLENTRISLRKNFTEAELLLWEALGDKKFCNLKFRRQHSIDDYIVEFYCPSERLVIEFDGQHQFTPEGIVLDKERDNHLKMIDIKVLRFENEDILNNLTEVLKKIKAHFANLYLRKNLTSYSPFFNGLGLKSKLNSILYKIRVVYK